MAGLRQGLRDTELRHGQHIQDKSGEISALESRVGDLEEELRKARESHQTDRHKHNLDSKQHKQDLHRLHGEAERHRTDHAALQARLDVARSEADTLAASESSLQDANKALKEELAALRSDLQDKERDEGLAVEAFEEELQSM